MGILEGMVAGAGEALQNVGLQGVAAAIQADRDARLSELRLSEEATIRQRGKDDAAAERTRVADYSKPIMGQATPAATATADAAGLNDASSVGADEGVGVNVQKISRAPTAREAQQRASAAGDLKSAESFGKDADRQEDNLRGDAKQKSDDARLSDALAETIRHNKALESNANYGRIPPAAKAQLEMASTYVMSAHKAEAEAAKALEAARKDTLASPEKIKQLEGDYQTSKAAVASALKQYDQIGALHFGEQWKKIETPAVEPPPAGGKIVYGADGKIVRDKPAAPAAGDKPAAPAAGDKPAAPAAGDKPAAPAAGGNEIQKIDAEIATIRTSLNTDKTRRTNPLKGGEILSADEVSRLEARLSELKTRRQKIGGLPIMDAASGIMNAVRN